MQKIPTLFVRDPDTHFVTNEVTPGCEWVMAGEGVPTRKFDGTCVMFDGTDWWARREVKPGKEVPHDFVTIQTDENTGKTVGWEPAENTGFWKYLIEAIENHEPAEVGTYELCGPKINGNPEGMGVHMLLHHGGYRVKNPSPMTFDSLREMVQQVFCVPGEVDIAYEGYVWHHPDGRMAKLKRRDFPK